MLIFDKSTKNAYGTVTMEQLYASNRRCKKCTITNNILNVKCNNLDYRNKEDLELLQKILEKMGMKPMTPLKFLMRLFFQGNMKFYMI